MIDVLYILGTAHCGSTMLAFLLNSHPEMVSIGESAPSKKRDHDRHLHPCSCGAPIGECEFWTEVFKRVTGEGHEFTPLKWVMAHPMNQNEKRLLFTGKSNAAVDTVRRMALKTKSHSIREFNELNHLAMKTILDVTGKKVYVDASKGSVRLELLAKNPAFNIHVLWLVRDVRGFANSMKNRGQSVEGAALRWKKEQIVNARLFRRFPEHKRMLLPYEDLCRDPQKKLAEVFQMVGAKEFTLPEDFRATTHHIIGHKMRLSGASTVQLKEKWREGLTAEEQNIAIDIANPLAVEMGYTA